jgi:hypothetical protein
MPLPDWLVPAATGVAGLVAGLLINHSSDPDSAAVEGAPVVVVPGTDEHARSVGSATPVTLDDLRRVVREELAAQPGGAVPQGNRTPELEGSIATSVAEQNAAAAQAQALLDAALSRRSWTDADREALHAQFPVMSPEQRDGWMQQYAQAINQGRLVADSERPPF